VDRDRGIHDLPTHVILFHPVIVVPWTRSCGQPVPKAEEAVQERTDTHLLGLFSLLALLASFA
jgi:hypothetical protein